MKSWDTFFIEMAMLISSKSKDPSTKVGCVIVGPDNEVRSTGFNGFPRGVIELADAREHAPVEIEKLFSGDGYNVKCTCGDIIQLGGHRRGGWDVLPDNPLAQEQEDPRVLMAQVEAHEHFVQPEIVLHPERWERPLKYDLVEHAERNAVYNAARVGIPLDGCRAYLNWEPLPCKECTKAFIQAGITEIIGPDIEFPNHKKAEAPDEDQWQTGDQWKFSISETMLNEAGVTFRRVPWDAERGDCL